MRSMGMFNLAALVASAMVLTIAAVLVPDKSWSNVAITSVMFFALSVGFIFYVPSMLVKNQSGSDAAQMASLGPLGVITGWTLLLTAGAFVLALFGMDKLAWALDIFAVGTFIISGLMLRAATDVISNVTSQYSGPSKHIRWQGEVQGLSSIASDSKSKTSLEQLAEKLRYAASDVPGGSPQDSSINSEVLGISDQLSVNSAADVQSQISKIEMLIAQRDVFLRSARNKA
ncbi:MAG: hypothetical protein HY935_05875, partial [Nitrosomonadales bacterium]|nr:hypothetical protein [Nitrosomonadales bacterium]